MENNEIDQVTVDVIKIILESKNGKEWFYEYLRSNLSLHVYSDGLHGVNINITFNGQRVSGSHLGLTFAQIHGT